jgi:CRP-like cAMP-binding protein
LCHADFQEEDIQQVVETFSILNMAPGEKLITKGEYATFCGIVLQGTFSAIVTPTFTVALKQGDVIGEMALFVSDETI